MAVKNNNTNIQQAIESIKKAEQAVLHEITDSKSLLEELLELSKSLYHEGELDYSRRLADSARKVATKHAKELLAKPPLNEKITLVLSKQLKGLYEHTWARKLLLELTKQGCMDKKVFQQLSLNTYKDDELPPDTRFSEALKILEKIGLREQCTNPETLGQGGAIYKRKFERSGQIDDLQTALYFYSRGWEVNPIEDMGYCGVNAAYILDQLAHRSNIAAAREKIPDRESAKLKQQATDLRKELLEKLPELAEEKDNISLEELKKELSPAEAKKKLEPTGKQWWYQVTMAELEFGLQNWDKAKEWLKLAHDSGHFEWERQTTTKQLVAIARLQGFNPPSETQAKTEWAEPWKALAELLGHDNALAAFECFRGKVGLALSGGGFRASLYHLGVLARLAEVDALRSVEVLSTVSGGSIVGAHYYLALRKLLESKADGDIKRDDYIKLVNDVTEQFFKGVSENLRVRVISGWRENLKMLFKPGYGRSNRIGELYERYLFDKVETYYHPTSSGECSPDLRPMRDQLIHPLTYNPSNQAAVKDKFFRPQFSNWQRRCKVPTLLLNTTSLNSGHNWQFTASWMGEPPGLTGQDIDMNERYRRLYYHEAPTEKLKKYPLGYAVAASAGVPALFDPLELADLYPGRTIRLVDGGVHDNQGVAGLLDEGCDLILCSDASGQMDDQDSPASGVLSVFFRSDSILQDRVREAQFQDLMARAENHALQGLFFIHLKQELDTDPIDWIHCDNPSTPTNRMNQTSYGIDRTLQRHLAEIRTDLDSFTEVEAYALMASGYLMTKHQLGVLNKTYAALHSGTWADFEINAPEQKWVFSPIIPILAADPEGSDRKAKDLEQQLRVSKNLFGKVWLLIPALKFGGPALLLAVLGLLGIFIKNHWQSTINIELGVASLTMAIVLFILVAILPLSKYFKPLDTVKKWSWMLVLGTVGWAAANMHLKTFDKWFKARGKLERLLKLPD